MQQNEEFQKYFKIWEKFIFSRFILFWLKRIKKYTYIIKLWIIDQLSITL